MYTLHHGPYGWNLCLGFVSSSCADVRRTHLNGLFHQNRTQHHPLHTSRIQFLRKKRTIHFQNWSGSHRPCQGRSGLWSHLVHHIPLLLCWGTSHSSHNHPWWAAQELHRWRICMHLGHKGHSQLHLFHVSGTKIKIMVAKSRGAACLWYLTTDFVLSDWRCLLSQTNCEC